MIEELCAELADLLKRTHTEAELATMLGGLLTPMELEEVGRRWELMVGLMEGETQRDISERLGVSLGKIARGSRLLKYGPPEFREVATRIHAERKESGEE